MLLILRSEFLELQQINYGVHPFADRATIATKEALLRKNIVYLPQSLLLELGGILIRNPII
jgi:hypothetical protein